jgi:hypothetical protein
MTSCALALDNLASEQGMQMRYSRWVTVLLRQIGWPQSRKLVQLSHSDGCPSFISGFSVEAAYRRCVSVAVWHCTIRVRRAGMPKRTEMQTHSHDKLQWLNVCIIQLHTTYNVHAGP